MSKVDLCNKALSLIGNKTITNIETPTTTEEKICKLWYDQILKQALINAGPNFARTRAVIPMSNYISPFGFTNSFKIPNDCLKVLGIGEVGNIRAKYSVEGDYILTNENNDNSLQIRYIKFIEDDTKFSSGFIDYFIHFLASNICYQINKDGSLKQELEKMTDKKLLNCRTAENQESKIEIKNDSRYKNSRY